MPNVIKKAAHKGGIWITCPNRELSSLDTLLGR